MDNMRFASDLRLALDLIMEAARARPNESVIVRLSEPCDTNPSACKLERVEPYGIHHACGVGCKTRDTNPDGVEMTVKTVELYGNASNGGSRVACECRGDTLLRYGDRVLVTKLEPTDTNPDAAAAEAAQEAVEEPVHGQDDPVYLRAMIANRDKQLAEMTKLRDYHMRKGDEARRKLYAMTADRDSARQAVDDHAVSFARRGQANERLNGDLIGMTADRDDRRQTALELQDHLLAMTTRRDNLAKELDELGVTHGILHGQFVSAIEDCDKMTSERDALKAKFDEAVNCLRKALKCVSVDIKFFKIESLSENMLNTTRQAIDDNIARLESQ